LLDCRKRGLRRSGETEVILKSSRAENAQSVIGYCLMLLREKRAERYADTFWLSMLLHQVVVKNPAEEAAIEKGKNR